MGEPASEPGPVDGKDYTRVPDASFADSVVLWRLADCRTPLPPPVILRSTHPPVPPPPTHTLPRCPRIPLSIRPLGGGSRHIDLRRVIARRCRPRPWSTWNTIARPCLACRGAWYEASSGKTVVLFKFLKIIIKSQSQTSRFWCYTMLQIIAIAMSMSIIVTTLNNRSISSSCGNNGILKCGFHPETNTAHHCPCICFGYLCQTSG